MWIVDLWSYDITAVVYSVWDLVLDLGMRKQQNEINNVIKI
jgi:hypothetical protein